MTNKKIEKGAQKPKAKAVTRSPRTNKSTPAKQAIDTTNGENRYQMIAAAAYYRAEKRDFNGGDAVQDWLEAEMEIDNARQI